MRSVSLSHWYSYAIRNTLTHRTHTRTHTQVLHALLAMDARRREAVFRTKLGRAEFRVSHK